MMGLYVNIRDKKVKVLFIHISMAGRSSSICQTLHCKDAVSKDKPNE